MENEIQNKKRENLLPLSIFLSALMLAGAWVYKKQPTEISAKKIHAAVVSEQKEPSAIEEAVLPSHGVALPVVWGDLGAKLASVGAIDAERFKALYDERGAFTEEYRTLLYGTSNGKLKITKENSGYLLNLFWALGLASKNPILDSGEMQNPAYGGAGNFASTGGWTMAKGNAMDHYSKHLFFTLTTAQQTLVDKVSKGIYRPCCGNSVHFPDCNHGMAMLGLLELMASQGANEQEMWNAALTVNSYWFPDTYLTIASYMKNKGVEWWDANPKEMLGADYSSASGYRRIASQVIAPRTQQGGGCGVDNEAAIAPQSKQRGGCEI